MPEQQYTHLLKDGIRSRMVQNVNGLTMHILEAGYEQADAPRVLLLHGFPELAFSWRYVMPILARAGYHVIAPDQRGYGQTTGWDSGYDGDLNACQMTGLVTDLLALINEMGYPSVATVVGHDFGSRVAAFCALIRPDVFRSVAMMSAPFSGPPTIGSISQSQPDDIHTQLRALTPPRKHYQWYYSTREANDHMQHSVDGVKAFLRAYFHVKSADYAANQPFELASWSASELAKLPRYYVMNDEQTMADTVRADAPSPAMTQVCQWLTDHDLEIFASEFARTGFQGGLNWYRCGTDQQINKKLALFCGQTIDVPSRFIAGRQDWGIHQIPGALTAMQTQACTQMDRIDLIDNAGHWVQQEQPSATAASLLNFITTNE